MAKQLNVNLGITADTSKAKAALNELTTSLNQISSGVAIGKDLPITNEIREAQVAAQQLSMSLTEAFNVDTGKLDLNKFNSSLRASGMSLSEYGNKLSALGATGDQAFLKIAQSIVTTEAPLRRSSALLTGFMTTLKNTARWQISSSILHGFMGAVQSAYGYAQDLDESLNNIRIVTGQNADQMAEFAKQANKAAKALSTTTTEYTDAALIYYQQGLNDEQVMERTNVTVKMANVAGETAEVVSDQLTAVWNNFYEEGGKSLEYYADVMTALGAATASSTDEIAEGLEKFASVADTVGLSYEYATSALATVTATTRQSADVVGTAFKTLFARIQDLELGKTLDDGTTLGTYSEALAKVGINIKDSSGNLKEMNDILDEMGSKWGKLNKDQQVALAQQVAGVRQYTQLVALMENWDYFQENLDVAENASGTLSEQAKIYEESWQASSDRVRASMESIYGALLDEDFFISLNDGLAQVADTVKMFIDSLGGIKGVIAGLGLVITSVFKNQMTDGINNALHNFKNFTGVSKQEMLDLQNEAKKYAEEMTRGLSADHPETRARVEHLQRSYEMQERLRISTKGMTDEQIKAAQSIYKTANAYSEMALEAGQAAEAAKQLRDAQRREASSAYGQQAQSKVQRSSDLAVGLTGNELLREGASMLTNASQMGIGKDTTEYQQASDALVAYRERLEAVNGDVSQATQQSEALRTAMGELAQYTQQSSAAFDQYISNTDIVAERMIPVKSSIEQLQATLADTQPTDEQTKEMDELIQKAEEVGLPIQEFTKIWNNYKKALQSGNQSEIKKASAALGSFKFNQESVTKAIQSQAHALTDDKDKLAGLGKEMEKQASQAAEAAVKQENFTNATEQAESKLSQFRAQLEANGLAYKSLGSAITGTLRGISSFAMGLQSLSSIKDTLNNDDLSSWEKTLQIMMSLGMAIPMVTTGLKSLGNAYLFVTSTQKEGLTYQLASLMGITTEITSDEKLILSKRGVILARGAAGDEAVVEALKTKGAREATKLETKEIWANIAAKLAQHWYILVIIAAIGVLIGIIYLAVKAYNAEAEALERANATLEASTEAYNKAGEAVDNFKDKLSDYQDALKGLKELEEGSQELADAVEEANEKANELIETYGLYGKYTFGENGEIIIDPKALDDAEKALEQVERRAGMLKYSAEINQDQAELDKTATDLGREITYYRRNYQVVGNNGTRGSYIDAEGNEQVILDYQSGMKATKEQMYSLAEATKKAQEANGGASLSLDELKTAIKENSDEWGISQSILDNLNSFINDETIGSLTDLANSMDKATEAALYYARQMLGLSVEDVYGETLETLATKSDGTVDENLYNLLTQATTSVLANNQSNIDEYIAEQQKQVSNSIVDKVSTYDAGDVTEDNVKNYLDELFGDVEGFTSGDQWIKDNYAEIFKGTSLSYDSDINAQEMAQAYYESLGYKITSVQDKSGKTILSGTDSEGNTVEDMKIDNEQAQILWGQMIANYAIEQMAKQKSEEAISKEDIESIYSSVLNADESYGADWSTAFLTGLANPNLNEQGFDFSSLYGQLNESEIKELRALSGEDLAAIFGLTPEQIGQVVEGGIDTFEDLFKEGLEDWTQEAYEQGADAVGEQRAESLELDSEVFKSYRDQLAATNEELANERDLLNEVAIVQMRTDRAMQSLADNWEDWDDIMTDSESTIGDIAELMPDLRSMMEDLFDWSSEDVKLLPEDFYKDNWDIIQDVYNGVDGAVEKLQGLATKEYIIKLGLEEDLSGDALTAYNDALTMLDSVPDLELGMTLDDAGMYNAFQALLDAGVVTVDQMNAILENVGFDPQIEMEKIDLSQFQASEDGNTYTMEYMDTEGNIQTRTIKAQTYHDAEAVGYVEFPVINNSKTTYTGAGGVNVKAPKSRDTGSGSGGKSSKPEKVDKTKKTDVVERYKEINDQLDDIKDKMDDASKAADRLYGPARLKEMNNVEKSLKNQISLLKKKNAEAKSYLEIDRTALQTAAKEAGLGEFTFDSDDNIKNYEEQMSILYNQLAAAEAKADPGNFKTKEAQDEYIKNNVDPIQERIDAVKDAISQYDETRELIEDLDNELQDAINAWQDNNYEKLTYKLELKLNVSEVEMEELDYWLNKISDDFYLMSEAAATMRSQMDVSNDIIEAQKQHVINLENEYNTIDEETGQRRISQADYIDGLKESRSAMYSELEALLELDKSMQEHYGNTVDMANEELAEYTDRMEHLTSVLDHYQNLLELTGRSKDYENVGKVLRGQAQVIKDQAKVSKATYEMYAREAAELKAQMEAAEGTDNYDFIREQWLAAQTAVEEAQDQMLSDAEEWAEAMKAAIENELEGLADVLENALTADFGSFDYMSQQMERAQSLQEEYLTTTNKVYETTKLMRTAQNAIDKTTNTVAKQRLQNFINETSELQNQTKLSQYELEIQQAKYDLLLAEIALEEAQNAKSTVRLQRDSEGNFGYVYTADQEKVAQAQQELEDAQNSLYNIGLEGANDYAQKYQEALSAMYDELTELQEQWLNGEITTQQEYNEKMQAIQDHYYETLKNYSNLYQVAITTDSRVVADAWSSDFADMTLETDKWMNAVSDYVDECESKFQEWQQVIQDVEEYAGVDLDNLASAVKGITDESKDLEDTLTDPKDGVIAGLEKELVSVRNVTDAYLAQRDAILQTISALETYLTRLGQKIAAESQSDDSDSDSSNTNSSSGTGNGSGNDSGKSSSAKSQARDIITGVHNGSIPVTSSGWVASAQSQGYSSEAISIARQALNDSKAGGGYSYDYNKALELVGMDTGGYTGIWGPEGKLALLHEKELVLNANDTENFLASMDVLHSIIDTIDMQAMSAQMGGLLSSPSYAGSSTESLEQHVTIEANFPGVTSRIEIEEAFENLINKASQYAYRD